MAAQVGFEPTGLLHHNRFQVYALVTAWVLRHINWKLLYAYHTRFANLSPPVVIKGSAIHSSMAWREGFEPSAPIRGGSLAGNWFKPTHPPPHLNALLFSRCANLYPVQELWILWDVYFCTNITLLKPCTYLDYPSPVHASSQASGIVSYHSSIPFRLDRQLVCAPLFSKC